MIGHIDADCFYVSCERIRYPSLNGKPVGVLGNQGACVIAKSYEAKARGIKTGVPIWEAVAICPEMVFVKRDFRWYEVISHEILNLTKRFSERVEYYSIDEMFFDARRIRDIDTLRQMQETYQRELGVPMTIGVAPTKMLAKLVSDTSKPCGCGWKRSKSEIEELLGSLSVQEITGIAQRRARTLESCGIHTCLDFSRADPGFIRRKLTVGGEKLWTELNGSPAFPLQEERPLHKCISRGGSIWKATADPTIIWAWIVRNLERLVVELDHYRLTTRRLVIVMQQQMDAGWSDSVTFPVETASFEELLAGAKVIFDRNKFRIPVVKMHLLANQLYRRTLRQRSLFSNEDPRHLRIAAAKRAINEKIERFTLRSGATLPLEEIHKDETNEFDICDIRGKMCF